jgi:hypothetical protein
VVLNDAGGILAYGRARRLASPAQRLALIARDQGCTFPRCRETAARSEVHHITDWVKGGQTNIDTLALACGHDNGGSKGSMHHRFARTLWTVAQPSPLRVSSS